jgi:hypothetical protein
MTFLKAGKMPISYVHSTVCPLNSEIMNIYYIFTVDNRHKALNWYLGVYNSSRKAIEWLKQVLLLYLLGLLIA